MEKDIKNIIKKIKEDVEKISKGEMSDEIYETKSKKKMIEFAHKIKNIRNIKENIVFEGQDGTAITFNIETGIPQYFSSDNTINLGLLDFCEKIFLKYVSNGKRRNNPQIERMEVFL